MQQAIAAARMRGHGAILLVGDAPYYGRFGFSAEKTGLLWMPGSYRQDRLLGLELRAGALDGARGMIGATGRLAPKPDLRCAGRGGFQQGCQKPDTARSLRFARDSLGGYRRGRDTRPFPFPNP